MDVEGAAGFVIAGDLGHGAEGVVGVDRLAETDILPGEASGLGGWRVAGSGGGEERGQQGVWRGLARLAHGRRRLRQLDRFVARHEREEGDIRFRYLFGE